MTLGLGAYGEALEVSSPSSTSGNREANEGLLSVYGQAYAGYGGGGFGQDELMVVHFPSGAECGEVNAEESFGTLPSEPHQTHVGAAVGVCLACEADEVSVEVVGEQRQIATDAESGVEKSAGLIGGEGRGSEGGFGPGDGSCDVYGVIDEGAGEWAGAGIGDDSDERWPVRIGGA